MNDFLSALQKVTNNDSYTENGALGYKSTHNSLVDINFRVSSLRNEPEEQIIELWEKAYEEDKKYAIVWMFMVGDIRGGMGERRLFRILIKNFIKNHLNNCIYPETLDFVEKIINFIPQYNRWDSVFCLLEDANNIGYDVAFDVIRDNLTTDMDIINSDPEGKKPISLLGKWMPSANTSSKKTVALARKIIKNLEISEKQYRKMLSVLRKRLDVLERRLSANEWELVDYSAVPSKANIKYSAAFFNHDFERRSKFIEAAINSKHPEEMIHSSASFPHEIIKVDDPASAQALWNAYPNFLGDEDSILVVRDGSGSMTCKIDKSTSALDVATALTIYFAEKLNGPLKDKFITFSRNPRLIDMSKANEKEYPLREKLNICYFNDDWTNTNIQAVFELLLRTAKEENLTQADLPKNILIISDMEFDAHSMGWGKSLFSLISDEFKLAGYKLPKLIFWNVNSRSNTIPMIDNELGLVLVSGFSPMITKMILSNNIDPWGALKSLLDDARYKPIKELFNEMVDVLR